MKIYGAGMAGLIAANILRRHNPTVHEMQKELPNNHAALLRFRSEVASEATGIPFKKVSVTKAIGTPQGVQCEPDLVSSNLYSRKVTGKVMGRSINDLTPVIRYIAPPDFINQASQCCDIEYESLLTLGVIHDAKANKEPIISTIPMPTLMSIVKWPEQPEFNFKSIWSFTTEITVCECDIYQTVYFPSPDSQFYRASITGNKFIVEFIEEPDKDKVSSVAVYILQAFFGIDQMVFDECELKHQYYGKLMPVDEAAREQFIMAMTDEFGIYALGRFATWRQLLLDDIVADVHRIAGWVDTRSEYERMADRLKRMQNQGLSLADVERISGGKT